MVLCTISASAQWITSNDNGFKAPFSKIETPTPSFHSTSTMLSCNSIYASTPTISSNGLAGEDDSTDSSHPKNPRKITPPVPGGDPTPVGDAILPLMLLAAVYTLRVRRTRTINPVL